MCRVVLPSLFLDAYGQRHLHVDGHTDAGEGGDRHGFGEIDRCANITPLLRERRQLTRQCTR
jgi:hypothetical protein